MTTYPACATANGNLTSMTSRPAALILSGELDMSARFRAEQQLDVLLAEPPEHLVVDLRDVTFIDSTGLGLILDTHERARREGVPLSIRRGTDEVQRVFELAGVADVLPFE